MKAVKKIMLVDDEAEILDLLDTFTQCFFPNSETLLARDGEEALEQLNRHQDIELIICDYNMPKGNGGKVFQELQTKKHQALFCLCSARPIEEMPEFSKQKPFKSINKVNLMEDIKLLASELCASDYVLETKDIEYREIRISLLKIIGVCPVDLFIPIGTEKKIKIFSWNDLFSDQDFEKFSAKNIDALFYLLSDFSKLAPYLEKTFAHLLKDNKFQGKQDYFKGLAHGLDLVRLPFMSDEQVALAKKWMNNTLIFIQNNSNKSLSDKILDLLNEKSPWFSKHIALSAFFALDIANVMTLNSEQIMLKLNMAALLHDLELQNEQDEWDFGLGLLKKINIPFKDHPQKSIDQFTKLKIKTPDVDKIVRDHHELPDGTGFPHGLKGDQISQLSAIFIIAHSLSIICLEAQDQQKLERSILLQKLSPAFLNTPPFKEIIRNWMIS